MNRKCEYYIQGIQLIFTCKYVQEINKYAISTEIIEEGALTTVKKVVFGSTPKEGIMKLVETMGWNSLAGAVNIVDPANNSYNTTYYSCIGEYLE